MLVFFLTSPLGGFPFFISFFLTRQPIAEHILVNKALEIMKISDTSGETLNNYKARQ